MLAVSIVIHDTPPATLLKCLKSLLVSEVEDIYIIDNGKSEEIQDADIKKIMDYDIRISYYHVANHGYGAAHNYAIRKSLDRGVPFHLVLNPDVYWEGDVISPMLEFMSQDNSVGLLAPKILYPDGTLQYTCRRLPTPRDLFLKRFLPSRLTRKSMRKYLLKDYDHESPLNCPYLQGSFMLLRTETLRSVGLFDPGFFLYPEDIDITRRIHEKWKTLYWPRVTVIHEHQAASSKEPRMFFIHLANLIRYFNKWGWWRDSQRKLFNDRLSGQLQKINSGRDS